MLSLRLQAVRITASDSRVPSPPEAYNGIIRGGRRRAQEEDRVAGANPPITSILPDEGWAPLLEIIVRDAPTGAVIEVHTPAMQTLAERMLQAVGRQDVTVVLRPPRGITPPPPNS